MMRGVNVVANVGNCREMALKVIISEVRILRNGLKLTAGRT